MNPSSSHFRQFQVRLPHSLVQSISGIGTSPVPLVYRQLTERLP